MVSHFNFPALLMVPGLSRDDLAYGDSQIGVVDRIQQRFQNRVRPDGYFTVLPYMLFIKTSHLSSRH
ncbi:hypothetical protein [Glaciimonas soli]|uniref:Uncharacterized protein n=1 Tax=Glaciimonas soli TaxID=2590999 RepID=A0A843YTI3_9BURK|nr:hypothetical protein [Glaciimonas soli]MQR00808.1 hypothetical protein [Glaciimonas soli]